MPLAKLQASRAPGDFPESRLSDLPWTAVRRRVALIKQTVRARSARISHRGNAQKSRTFKRVARDPHGVEQASIALRYWSVECDFLASASGFVKRREPRDAWVYGTRRNRASFTVRLSLRELTALGRGGGPGVERCRSSHKDLMHSFRVTVCRPGKAKSASLWIRSTSRAKEETTAIALRTKIKSTG